MPSIAESYDSQGKLAAPLKAGLETLSDNQTIRFTRYVKAVLPLDGFVFWIRSDLASQAQICQCYQYSGFVPKDGTAPYGNVVDIPGSFHYASEVVQEEDQSIAVNKIIFTAEQPIQEFNFIGPHIMYIGEFEGIRFAFNHRKWFYKQADIYHYEGHAVFPALETQLIDDISQLDLSNVVVSNSLPIWLTLNKFMPMYPSYLVLDNVEPPYASVHIIPESTQAIAERPQWGPTGTHSQLVKEKVRITLYGLRNFNALDFQDYVFQYSLDNPSVFGVMNMPVMQDLKRTQSELLVIAQKKQFEIEINYYQLRVREIARQLILHCIPEIIVQSPVEVIQPGD